ncbi:hypothetical protein [Acinetobacter sp. Marseille-Q1618]|uniref:hypothetical protein n=1 Tax=Acinetobacter sp. Marseille-Q1618 TaxID=2697502 RepID=UPI0015705D8C|nr:hypothetical protein [Acinetobacter sp. Marseille-Q1618]
MPTVDVDKLDRTLQELVASHKKPEKILLGFKAYSELMNHPKFADEIVCSAINPNKRTYKKIKIKVTQDDYQFEVKCSN